MEMKTFVVVCSYFLCGKWLVKYLSRKDMGENIVNSEIIADVFIIAIIK